MIRFMQETRGPSIGLEVSGEVDSDDFRAMAELIRECVEEHGQIRLLLRLDPTGVTSPDVLWEQLKLAVDCFGRVERVALVGDIGWEAPYTRIVGPLLPAKTRHFEPDDVDAAWSWLREGER